MTSETAHLIEESAAWRFGWAGQPLTEADPESEGSVFDSVMNLCACAFGASMLSLPYAMDKAGGFIFGFVLLSLMGLLCDFCAHQIVYAGARSSVPNYPGIMKYYFGTIAGISCDVMLAGCLLIAAVSYMVGLVDILPQMIPFMGVLSRTHLLLLTIVITFPLTLVSNMSAFGPSSSIAVVGCYVFALALLLAAYIAGSAPWSTDAPFALLFEFTVPSFAGIFEALPILVFVYAYHYILPETLGELKDPSAKRAHGTIFYTGSVLYGCYAIVTFCGYLLVRVNGVKAGHIPDNLLLALGSKKGGTSVFTEVLIGIANWVMGSLLLATYALFVIPLRRRLNKVVRRSREPSAIREGVIAGCIAIAVLSISLVLTDLALVNSVGGGFLAIVMLVFPGLLDLHALFNKAELVAQPYHTLMSVIAVVIGSSVCLSGISTAVASFL